MKKAHLPGSKSWQLLFTMFLTVIFLTSSWSSLQAQAPTRLGVQGILKKGNGEAVDDGNYDLTFRLYTAPPANTLVWEEEQTGVEVISGIYSTVLGNNTPLNAAFDQPYYLGVAVENSAEMTPRIQLTSAPYALSLIGSSNQFPSTGQVIADEIKVNGNVLAQPGTPGASGQNKNGYGFLGEEDSGLYSDSENQVSVYVNNVEIMEIKPDSVEMKKKISAPDLGLKSGGNISYNGLDDWRLVSFEDFSTGTAPGWNAYTPIAPELVGWNSNTSEAVTVGGSNGNYSGRWIMPQITGNKAHRKVLKKEYVLNSVGTYSMVKIKFKYYAFDSWDGQDGDQGFAMIAENVTGTQLRIGWILSERTLNAPHGNSSANMGTTGINEASSFFATTTAPPHVMDYSRNGEMTFSKGASNSFWLMFGSRLDEDSGEHYGVSMIEIWVK